MLDALSEYCADMSVYQVQVELFRVFQNDTGLLYLARYLENLQRTEKQLFVLFGLSVISQLMESQVELVRKLANVSELDQISIERLLEIFLRTK